MSTVCTVPHRVRTLYRIPYPMAHGHALELYFVCKEFSRRSRRKALVYTACGGEGFYIMAMATSAWLSVQVKQGQTVDHRKMQLGREFWKHTGQVCGSVRKNYRKDTNIQGRKVHRSSHHSCRSAFVNNFPVPTFAFSSVLTRQRQVRPDRVQMCLTDWWPARDR